MWKMHVGRKDLLKNIIFFGQIGQIWGIKGQKLAELGEGSGSGRSCVGGV
jgi:hypothetical protein